MQPLRMNMRAVAMCVEAEHIHQSAAALATAPINRSTMSPVAPSSKTVFHPAVWLHPFVSLRWHGNKVNVCVTTCPGSSSLLCLARTVTLSAATALPPRLLLVLMATRSSRSEPFSVHHVHISAHMGTYKHAECTHVLQHAICCVGAILF